MDRIGVLGTRGSNSGVIASKITELGETKYLGVSMLWIGMKANHVV